MIARIPAYPGLPPPRAQSPRLTTPVVVGVSVALHLGLFGYLALQKFAPPPTEEVEPLDHPTTVVLSDWKPPKAVVTPEKTSPIHKPIAPVDPTVSTLPVNPPDTPKIVEGPVKTVPVDPGPAIKPVEPNPVITSPSWIRKPGPKEFARFYPDRAVRMEKSGLAVLTCHVTPGGAVVGCQVASETPASFGFGEAALKLAPYFQLSPPMRDGQPIEGARIQIPIRFALGG